jgi:serine protease AprX
LLKVRKNNLLAIPGISKSALSTVALLCFGFAGAQAGHGSKCEAFVNQQLATKNNAQMNVILKLSGNTSAESKKLSSEGADVYRNLSLIHSVAVRIRKDNLREVIQWPEVLHVSNDATTNKTDQFTVASSKADVAYSEYGLTGSGVGIAVIDSGVGTQADFNGSNGSLLGCVLGLLSTRVQTQVNFVPGESANDLCGHGTHVAGILAGNGESSSLLCSKTFYGIARSANIVSVKVLNQTGQGTVSQAVAGVQWAVTNKNKYNIRIINISFGHPVGESYTQDPLCQAVEAAWRAGIFVVCAAGNDGRLNANPAGTDNGGYGTAYGTIECPGNDPYVITVGAMKSMDGNRAHDQVATYSSRGPSRLDYVLKPDIMAPGNQVISVEQSNAYLVNAYAATNQVPYSYYTLSLSKSQSSNNYFKLSGTSMAAPVISGAAAMLLQQNPYLSPDTLKLRLMATADKWTDTSGNGDACTYGAGYVDIPAALQTPILAAPYALSPVLTENADGTVSVQMFNANFSTSIWGTSLWNLNTIYGQVAFSGSLSTVLSSSHAIWGKDFWDDSSTTSISTSGVDLSAGSIAIQGEH